MSIEKADIPYSQWVRLNETDDEGFCKCYTCPAEKKWTEMECGHYIDRVHKYARFLPINTHPQCFECNHEMRGNIETYRENLVRDYGENQVKVLEESKYQIYQLKESNIKYVASVYSAEVRKLRKEKGL